MIWSLIDEAPLDGTPCDLWCRAHVVEPPVSQRFIECVYDAAHQCWRYHGMPLVGWTPTHFMLSPNPPEPA